MNPNDSTPQKQISPKTASGLNMQRPGDKISISPNNFYGKPNPGFSSQVEAPVKPVKGPAGPTADQNLRDLTNKNK